MSEEGIDIIGHEPWSPGTAGSKGQQADVEAVAGDSSPRVRSETSKLPSMGDDAAIAECAAYPLDVGDYRRPDIATRFPETGEWFHRGINWMFTFHHEESMRCFRKALALEPDFAMAHWGIAVCNCPNYNVHEKNGWFELSLQEEGFPSQKTAFEAAAQAVRFKGNANPAGRALIEAMQIRCVWPANDFARMLQRPYAEALRTVYLDYPEDPDVACIFAEALMQLTPWALFDAHDKTTAKHTPEIALILRTAIAQHPRHPGLLHLFIHLMEMSPTPADALPMADTLRSLSPDCGHLKHMPSHIDVLVGNYQAGARANELALAANARYEVMARREGLEFSMFIGYHAHDFHMCVRSPTSLRDPLSLSLVLFSLFFLQSLLSHC